VEAEPGARTLSVRELSVPTPMAEPRTARVVLRRPVGWLGINTVDVSDLRTTSEGRLVRYCAYPVVVSVEPGSPAEKGGLASGDTIVAYAGRDLLKSGEIALDRLFVPGQRLRVTVRRDGRTLTKPVTVEQRPSYSMFRSYPLRGELIVRTERDGRVERVEIDRRGAYAEGGELAASRARPPRPPLGFTIVTSGGTAPAPGDAPPAPAMPPVPVVIGFGAPSVVLGAHVVSADDDLREVLRAEATGVLVVRVLPGTPSANAGLRGGDVIVRAAGQQVLTPAALHRAVQRFAEERALPLRVDRAGHEKDVTLRW
jgi:serine protease Do